MSTITNLDEINNVVKIDKLYELDYMRLVACLAVMIVHITATGVTGYINGSFPHIVSLIINRSFKFTTPIFIFLSGITSFYSYRKKKFEYIPFVIKRLEKVFYAYFAWCLIYYAAYIKLGFYSFDIIFLIKSVFLGTMSYHLYFVIIIAQMYIIGPVFYKLLKNSNNRTIILVIFAVITYLCAEFIRFKNSDRIFLKYMFFYMLGIFVTLEYDRFVSWINKNKVIISTGYVALSIIYTVVSFYSFKTYVFVWFLFSIISIFFVYYIGMSMKRMLNKIYRFIKLFGQSSYYIYLMHPLILTIMILLTDKYGIMSITLRLIIYSITVIPFTVIACLAYTFIKNNIKKNKKAATAA